MTGHLTKEGRGGCVTAESWLRGLIHVDMWTKWTDTCARLSAYSTDKVSSVYGV